MNSYVRPKVMPRYLHNLESELKEIGAKADVNILRSDGGLMTTREAASKNPIYGVLSGPSGGVAGALYIATRAGFPNMMTFDMGGTSTDVSLCHDGEPTIGRARTSIGLVPPAQGRRRSTCARWARAAARSPTSRSSPSALRVGPQSAGAEPGPAATARAAPSRP